MKKNITIVLLTIISLFSFQQSYANIAEGRKDTFIWYITDEGQLVLAPDPDDGTYENLQQGEYNVYKENIKSAKVEAGVTPTTCRDMFSDLYNMETIDISGLNTENVADMISMFQNCSSLKAIDLSTLNTQNVTNMVGMFSYCSSLTSLDVSSLNTQNVMRMNYMFGFCSALESINFGNFNTSSATDMRQLFASDTSLKELDLSGFNTQKVTNMSQMFYDCSSLTKLNLTGFNNANATDISRMFMKCPALKTIISNRETPSTLLVGTFTDSFDNRDSCNLVVPTGSEELYAAADGWNELGSINAETNPVGPAIPADAIASGEVGTCIWYITSENELVIAPADGVSGDLPENGWESYFTGNEEEWNIFYTTPWSEYSQDILTAKIMPGVNATSCSYMFAGLNKIGSVDLSGLNTENVTNMSDMFYDCSSLISLDLINFNTQNVTDMGGMFSGCSSLTSLDLSNFNTQNVTNMSDMFHWCSSLTSLDLSNFNTQNVTYMYGLFEDCTSLTSINLSSFNTSKVTDMGYMFAGCSALTSIDVSHFNTQNVEYIYGMFEGCTSLTSLDVSHFNTENVIGMGGMFTECSSLTSLDVSNFNTAKVESIEAMFSMCSSLTSLDVSNFNTQNVKEMRAMFALCSSLTSLDISNLNTQNAEEMNYLFYGCSSLATLNLTNFSMESVTEEEYMANMFTECPALTTIISNRVNPSILKVGTFDSFDNRTNCTLVVPAGSEALYAAADGWNELSKINDVTPDVNPQIPEDAIASGETGTCIWYITSENELVIAPADGVSGDLPAEGFYYGAPWKEYSETIFSAKVMSGVNARSCAYMFNELGNLTSADLSGMNTKNVTDMVEMFWGCSALTSVDLSNFNTENVTDMSFLFYKCSSLKSLDLSNFNTENVTNMRYMFGNCSTIKSLDLSNFNTHNVTDMHYMFSSCSSLTSLDLSNFNTENVTDMSWMFTWCDSLVELNLTGFNMQNVTKVENMFGVCVSLTTIISNNEKPSPLKVGTFSESFDNRANCTLVVPVGSKALYAAADGWNELGNISEGNGQDDAYDEFMDLFAMLVDEFNYAKSQTVDNPQYNSNAKYEELVTETRGRFEDIWMHMMAIKEAAETVNAAGDTIAVREYIEDLVDVKYQIDETVNYFFSNIEDTNDAHGTSPLYLTSDEPFYNSGDYTAEKVTYTRHFSKHTKLHTSDGWETIILPFNVQKIVTEDGRLLAPFGSTLAQADVALPFWLAEMKDGQFVFATSIRANTPYIICMPNGDDINPKNCISGNVVFSASNTTVYASDKAQSVQGPEGFTFVPTYNFVDASDSVYAINDEVYSDGAVDYQPGSVFARNSRTVRPFEAYMQHDASSAFAPRFIPVMPDETDGIVTITPDTDAVSIYDLSGRKIDTMRKGVNIVVKDGKAVRIVKK